MTDHALNTLTYEPSVLNSLTAHNKHDLKMQNKPPNAQKVAVEDPDEPDDW